MTALQVRMFPKLSILLDGRGLEADVPSRARELFCYLLLHRHQSHHREALASLLWADSAPPQSRNNLRKALWQLRSSLSSGLEPGRHDWLLLESEWVGLNPQADVWVDVTALEQAFALARGRSGEDLSSADARVVKAATDDYRGDLLEGWHQDWCIVARERLQSMYLLLLDKIMQYCEVHADYETGLMCGARALRRDRAHERTHRQLMRLYYLSGDRTGALRQFQRCVAALRQELDVGPAEHTVWLYQQIQADTLVASQPWPGSESSPVAPHASPEQPDRGRRRTPAKAKSGIPERHGVVGKPLRDQS